MVSFVARSSLDTGLMNISNPGLDVGEQISRAPGRTAGGGYDAWGMKTTSTFKVIGRHVLNLWRIMRSEQTLNIYTFENVVFQLLRRRYFIPSCPFIPYDADQGAGPLGTAREH